MRHPWARNKMSLQVSSKLRRYLSKCFVESSSRGRKFLGDHKIKRASRAVLHQRSRFWKFPIAIREKFDNNKKLPTQIELNFPSKWSRAREKYPREGYTGNDTLVTVWVDLLTFLLFDFYCYFFFNKLRLCVNERMSMVSSLYASRKWRKWNFPRNFVESKTFLFLEIS